MAGSLVPNQRTLQTTISFGHISPRNGGTYLQVGLELPSQLLLLFQIVDSTSSHLELRSQIAIAVVCDFGVVRVDAWEDGTENGLSKSWGSARGYGQSCTTSRRRLE